MKRTFVLVTVLLMFLLIGGVVVWRLEGRLPEAERGSAAGNEERNPRVIIISEPALTDGIPHQYDPAALEAYKGMAEQLAEIGVTVVDKGEFQPSILQEFTSPEMFYKGYVRLGLEKKTEYIVVYNVYNIKPEGGEDVRLDDGLSKQAGVNISAHIVNTASGEINETHHRNVVGEDKETMQAAIRKAAREAGKEVAIFLKTIMDTKKRRNEYGN